MKFLILLVMWLHLRNILEVLLEGFTQIQVSTLAVKDGMIVAGGFFGELICKHLDRPGVSFCYRMTCEENAITNAVDIHRNSSGVRNFDMERFQLVQHFHYPWPVNRSSVSPDGKLVAIVGDDPDGLLVDSNNGETVGKLNGHLDYSFASAWHPNGVTFATGNQDKTCRVWDVRNLSKSVAVLKGNLGAIRSIRFSSDGQYMAMAVYSKNCSAFMYFISIFFCSCNDLSIQKKKRDLS